MRETVGEDTVLVIFGAIVLSSLILTRRTKQRGEPHNLFAVVFVVMIIGTLTGLAYNVVAPLFR